MKFFCHALFFALASGVPALFADETENTPKTSNPPAHSFAALLKNTPFKPTVKKIYAGKTTNANYRFQGILTIDGKTEFGLYDAQNQRSRWLKLRERDASGIVVESYDPKQKSLCIQTPTGRFTLTLPPPEEKPLGNSSQTAYRPTVKQTQSQASIRQRRQTQPVREKKSGENTRANRQSEVRSR